MIGGFILGTLFGATLVIVVTVLLLDGGNGNEN